MSTDNKLVRLQFVQGADTSLPLPTRATPEASGLDLRADLKREANQGGELVIAPGEWKLVPTGIRLALSRDMEGQVRPRSGLALRYGVTVLNAPGTVDSDYTGELKVILINHGREDFVVCHGDRIAQLVLMTLPSFKCIQVNELEESERGERGFGSSGTH